MIERKDWQSAFTASSLPSTVKLVLIMIGARWSRHGAGIFPSYRQIAEDCSLEKRTVIRVVGLAVELGWLKKTNRKRKNGSDSSNEYEWSIPDAEGDLKTPSTEEDGEESASKDTQGVTEEHQGGDSKTPRVITNLNHQSNPNTKPTSLSLLPDDELPNPQRKKRGDYPENFETAWAAYPSRPGANKAQSYRAWNTRIKQGESPDVMIAGVVAYAAYCVAAGTSPSYIKQPATFFGPDKHYLTEWKPCEAPAARITTSQQRAADFKRASYDRTEDRAKTMESIARHGINENDYGDF